MAINTHFLLNQLIMFVLCLLKKSVCPFLKFVFHCFSPHSELESLLHIIDEVCASTETKFYADTSTGLRLFNHQFSVSKSLPNDEIIPQNSISNTFMCNNDVKTISSHNTVTFTPYIVRECKQDQSLSMLHHCSHIEQNCDKKSSVETVPNQFSNQINKINSLLSVSFLMPHFLL